jgi:hypothetical protein
MHMGSIKLDCGSIRSILEPIHIELYSVVASDCKSSMLFLSTPPIPSLG